MFDVGVGEIVFLVILGIVLFGPERIPDMARKAARVYHYLRGVANNATGTLRNELGPEFADLQMSDLNPRQFAQKYLMKEIQPVLDDVKHDVEMIDQQMRAEVADVRELVEAKQAPASTANQPAATPTSAPFDSEAT
ncbi:sec-independent translocase [Granulicoccus phenolivorans]|uniref:sec-independent translocase n=1 Tax=Granulicoccus phenolivorans TaxID=266854 RepID=UPI000411297D|nr:sec-independent translocase [Granulicoccus phenolivorans]